ncbi:MAG: hypothetical protein RLZZ58_707 [Pseudomonadota bacterium]|jgi:16S rRNA (guanine527-N7)-methyltransferase
MTVLLADEAAARAWIADILSPDARAWARLDRFAAMLAAASAQQNLIAASTVRHMWTRHIVDSAQLIPLAAGADPRGAWIDLGSGAGLPGLVVAILHDFDVHLVESRRLRCEFLRAVVADLGLEPRVRVVESRLELVATTQAAVISARAFAPLPTLLALSARFSTEKTRWILPKGRNAAKELALLPVAWQRLFHVEQSLTDPDSAILVGTGRIGEKGRKSV